VGKRRVCGLRIAAPHLRHRVGLVEYEQLVWRAGIFGIRFPDGTRRESFDLVADHGDAALIGCIKLHHSHLKEAWSARMLQVKQPEGLDVGLQMM
jgi:hypothetical protein